MVGWKAKLQLLIYLESQIFFLNSFLDTKYWIFNLNIYSHE